MKKMIIVQLCLLVTGQLLSQANLAPPKEMTEAINKIAIIEGEWKGGGWMQMGPQKHEFIQIESVKRKVNGALLQIDGLGLDALDKKTVVHNAFALISYDPAKGEYQMQAYRGDGGRVDAYLKMLSDNSFEWGFKHPMAGTIKYVITVKDNEWIETGEASRDGNTWFKFIEMKLKKQ